MQLMELRKELKFNSELVQLIETLKNIAASQYHILEKEKERFDRFMDAFAEFFRVVDLADVENPLVTGASDILGLVVVTSDSGFMGGLNQGVMRQAIQACEGRTYDQVALVVIGDKGASSFGDQGRTFKFFQGISQETIYEQAVTIKDYIVQEVLERRMGRVVVAYPRPLSFSAQEIRQIDLLPCRQLFDRAQDSEVARRVKQEGVLAEARKVIIESSFDDMVKYLAGVWVTSKLYEVFEDSKLAEFSARAMHLEGSFQKIQKDFKKIQHQCFKATHEQIDKGMRESFAAKGGQRRRKRKTAQEV
ncbi:MAG: hypothetical protein A2340_02970 [Lentisphaerae bacterium RIFOXYB12_FULL_60_10]|nr:MAG: hypothetical protein A2340_02970 [Lentisphaerae bacterium RIFOXYB12_FULL_60_10]